MSYAIDPAADVMQKLIGSCEQAREGFRSAAEAIDNTELKRLFGIYAQQRTRFAEELREHLPNPAARSSTAMENRFEHLQDAKTADVLQKCLDTEKRSLDLYSQALSARFIPTRAHFLVSAQYSLLCKVHERVHGMFTQQKGLQTERD